MASAYCLSFSLTEKLFLINVTVLPFVTLSNRQVPVAAGVIIA